MYQKTRTFLKRLMLVGALGIFTFCNGSFLGYSLDDNDAHDRTQLINLLAISYFLYQSDVCNFAVSPVAGSASPTNSGISQVTGRVVRQDGSPVVSALVILDDYVDGTNTFYYSSHTSINRDGSFAIAGMPSGDYTLSIEPIDNYNFAGRIDTHIDCFQTPVAFTEGWYTGSGSAISTTAVSASTITVPTPPPYDTDVGTFMILE